MSYTWLCFDADGTLFDYDAAEIQALNTTLLGNGISPQPEYLSIYNNINAHMWHLFEKGEITSERLRVRRFEEFLQAIGVPADADKISDNYLFNLGHCTHLIDGAVDIIQKLAPRYHLALITNGLTTVQKPRLAASALAGYFQPVIISEEIGIAKPDPGYFQEALRLMGNPSHHQVLIIGDSLTSDIRGANLSGLDACWFNPPGKLLPDGFTARYQISRLPQLLEFL